MKKKETVAIKYDSKKDIAPKIAAKGKGEIAEKIIKIAKEEKIPIKEDPDLLILLSKLDIDQAIPESLYKAMADIFLWIYQINKE